MTKLELRGGIIVLFPTDLLTKICLSIKGNRERGVTLQKILEEVLYEREESKMDTKAPEGAVWGKLDWKKSDYTLKETTGGNLSISPVLPELKDRRDKECCGKHTHAVPNDEERS